MKEGFEEEYEKVGAEGVTLYGASLYWNGLSRIKVRTYDFGVRF